MSDALCYINNRFIPYAQASLHISDLGLQRGYGIFDYFLEVSGRIPFLDDYLDRFYSSAARLNLEVPLDRPLLKDKISYLLNQNNFVDSGIKLLLTGGYSDDLFSPGPMPNLMILNLPISHRPGDMGDGVKLILLDFRRHMPEVKTTFYLPSIALLPRLRERGAIEVLYHHNGIVSETTRANIFLVKNNILATPFPGVLQGITRKNILRTAREIMPVEEREVLVEELWEADEIFITGTSKHVLPVIAIEGRTIGLGRPGEITRAVSTDYEKFFDL